jgi:hypothetical protein
LTASAEPYLLTARKAQQRPLRPKRQQTSPQQTIATSSVCVAKKRDQQDSIKHARGARRGFRRQRRPGAETSRVTVGMNRTHIHGQKRHKTKRNHAPSTLLSKILIILKFGIVFMASGYGKGFDEAPDCRTPSVPLQGPRRTFWHQKPP